MEVPTEVLTAGSAAVAGVVGALWWQVRQQIRDLQKRADNLEKYIRDTLEGLVIEGHSRERCWSRTVKAIPAAQAAASVDDTSDSDFHPHSDVSQPDGFCRHLRTPTTGVVMR